MLLLNGCGRSRDASGEVAPRDPREAASRLQRVFENAAPEVHQNAGIAGEAMRKGDYERAVLALQVIRSGTNITLEQGLAIHYSVVAMEGKIINAMEAGDEKARGAYELLKELKRK